MFSIRFSFIFSWQKHNIPVVRCAHSWDIVFYHWNIKFISFGHRVMFSIYLNNFLKIVFLQLNKSYIWLSPVHGTHSASAGVFHLFWKYINLYGYASLIEKLQELQINVVYDLKLLLELSNHWLKLRSEFLLSFRTTRKTN